MAKTAQKIKATTQKFTEISDVADNVVLLTSGNACSIIKVQAINFDLLSEEEQNTRVYSYVSLLNSLSFSIQIFTRSKRIDITSYLKLLDQEVAKSQNQLLKNQIELYKKFVQELVKVNVVLDKEFYIVIPYTGLESGVITDKKNLLLSAKAKLDTKLESMHAMLRRMNLAAKTLRREELIKLFYEIYNGSNDIGRISHDLKNPAPKTG